MNQRPQATGTTGNHPRDGDHAQGTHDSANAPETVEIDLLQPGMSPRRIEDEEHIRRLAQTENRLPPILVHRPSMRIIDGMHRLEAARIRGQTEIEVIFFDGNEEDAFLRAVKENIAHGLPLPLADRKAAAERIICSHPDLSDRAIAAHTGLATKTIASLRRRSAGDSPQSNTRRGLDGRIRPLNATEGRRRAAEAIEKHPDASLREIARTSGVSLGTAHDVRWRLEHGEDPLPARSPRKREGVQVSEATTPADPETGMELSALLRQLSKDPSLRQTDLGRRLLRLLHERSMTTQDWAALIDSVPPHCAGTAARIAQKYIESWSLLARALEQREQSLP